MLYFDCLFRPSYIQMDAFTGSGIKPSFVFQKLKSKGVLINNNFTCQFFLPSITKYIVHNGLEINRYLQLTANTRSFNRPPVKEQPLCESHDQ